MIKVGITGNIGSGKTTVCQIFESIGIPVFYTDLVAKDIMATDYDIIKSIKTLFGDSSYIGDNLNKKYLSSIVFNDRNQLDILNSIIHPVVFRKFHEWVLNQNSRYILKESAILFESGGYKLCDKNIVVTCPLGIRIERVIKRDNVNEEDVLKRENNQISEDRKILLSDYSIKNDGCDLLTQVIELDKIL